VDIGAQRIQRHAALAIPLHARDLRAAGPAAAGDAYALSTQAHGRLHGTHHGAPDGHPALELLRDALGQQTRVQLGLEDLDDVERDPSAGALRKIGTELLDIGALLADDNPRRGGMDGDARTLSGPLDHRPADAGLGEP